MQTFLRGPRKCFACSQKSIGVRIRSLCNNIRECCSVFLKRSPILVISPLCFHLNRLKNGKCNCSLEEHLQNPKTWFLFTGRPRAFNFCQKFEFYLADPVPLTLLQPSLANRDPLILRFILLNICIWIDL